MLTWYRTENEGNIDWIAETTGEKELVKERVLAGLLQEICSEGMQEKKQNPHRLWPLYAIGAAASIALILSLFVNFWNAPAEQLPQSLVKNELFKNDVPHGGNKAILTLADGSSVILDNIENGVVRNEGGLIVSKSADGKIRYDFKAAKKTDADINTITTPKGGQYEVILSDGTAVWLNSGSSISFPTVFNGTNRAVNVTGETYFEVAKDKHKPFIVQAKDLKVEVLGTHFNIMAYDDEQTVAATLLEGSVKVSSNKLNAMLKPGEQARLSKSTNKMTFATTDTEGVMAWKNGYLMFINEDIHSVMRKIARWYDVEVVYEGDVSDKALWGTISRYKNVSQVLEMLEMTGVVNFKIEGRRITVMP